MHSILFENLLINVKCRCSLLLLGKRRDESLSLQYISLAIYCVLVMIYDYCKRTDTLPAWAGKPSASAKVTAALPIVCNDFLSHSKKVIRLRKS